MFDEGFNDVLTEFLCTNTQHLLHIENGNDLTEIQGSVDVASKLEFYIYPFLEKQTTVVHVSPTEDDPTFGFKWKEMSFINEFISVMLQRNQQLPLSTNPRMVPKIISRVRSLLMSMI